MFNNDIIEIEILAAISCYLTFYTPTKLLCQGHLQGQFGDKPVVWIYSAYNNHQFCNGVWCCLCAILIWPKGGSVDLPFSCSQLRSTTTCILTQLYPRNESPH